MGTDPVKMVAQR
jgi:hypothetical protein